jgi:hypothetical protein
MLWTLIECKLLFSLIVPSEQMMIDCRCCSAINLLLLLQSMVPEIVAEVNV